MHRMFDARARPRRRGLEAEAPAGRLHEVVRVDTELLEQVAVLLVVDLVGQLFGRLLMIAPAFLDLIQDCLFVELHKELPSALSAAAAERASYEPR